MARLIILLLLTGCATPYCQAVEIPPALIRQVEWPNLEAVMRSDAESEAYVMALELYAAELATAFAKQRASLAAVASYTKSSTIMTGTATKDTSAKNGTMETSGSYSSRP